MELALRISTRVVSGSVLASKVVAISIEAACFVSTGGEADHVLQRKAQLLEAALGVSLMRFVHFSCDFGNGFRAGGDELGDDLGSLVSTMCCWRAGRLFLGDVGDGFVVDLAGPGQEARLVEGGDWDGPNLAV